MNKAAEILKKREGFLASPGRDMHPDGRDVGTIIGHGRNLDRRPLTHDEGHYLLISAMDDDFHGLERTIKCFRMLDFVRQMALVLMAYQTGVGGVLGFRRMVNALNAGDMRAATAEALDSAWARNFPERAAEVAHMLLNGTWPEKDNNNA